MSSGFTQLCVQLSLFFYPEDGAVIRFETSATVYRTARVTLRKAMVCFTVTALAFSALVRG
jgi:hypothetical protein